MICVPVLGSCGEAGFEFSQPNLEASKDHKTHLLLSLFEGKAHPELHCFCRRESSLFARTDSRELIRKKIRALFMQIGSSPSKCQEPLNAPFLNGLFSRGFSRGKTAHYAIRGNSPLRPENGPLRRGNGPLRLFSGTLPCWKTAPLKRPIKRSMKVVRFAD